MHIETQEFIILQESIIESWAKDIVSLGLVVLMVFLNHEYIGNAFVLDFLAFILFFVFMSARIKSSKKFMTLEEAIAHLISKRVYTPPKHC